MLGWIADFVNKPKLVTICLFLGVVAVLPMLWSNSLWALWFFTGLYSVLDASIPVFWASVGDFFGRKSFGTIRGNMNLFYTWGAILGPFVAGAIYDRTQSYAIVFSAITVALIISAMTSLLIRAVGESAARMSRISLGKALMRRANSVSQNMGSDGTDGSLLAIPPLAKGDQGGFACAVGWFSS